MPIGIFKPAGEDPHDDARADVHDREIYSKGLEFLKSGQASPERGSETRSWVRRMEGAHQRLQARNAAREARQQRRQGK